MGHVFGILLLQLQHNFSEMKMNPIYSLAFLFLLFFSKANKCSKVKILIIRSPVSNTVAYSREDFWNSTIRFDKIDIQGESLASLIKAKVSEFEPAEEDDIDRKAAFIFETSNGAIDTIYSDIFFVQWDVHGKIHNDKSGFFKKLFRPFVTAN